MNIYLVLWILFCHWYSDFVEQTPWQADNKSKNFRALIDHTMGYSLLMWICAFCYICVTAQLGRHAIFNALMFWMITLVLHTATDYVTSRINARLYAEKRIHDLFVSIGFDQFLHFAQLLITFKLLLC